MNNLRNILYIFLFTQLTILVINIVLLYNLNLPIPIQEVFPEPPLEKALEDSSIIPEIVTKPTLIPEYEYEIELVICLLIMVALYSYHKI